MAKKQAPEQWASYAREIGLEIHRLRIKAGLTQEQLASAAGLTRSHYQQLEKGLSNRNIPANPSATTLVAIAQVLGLEPGALLPPGAPDITKWR